MKSTFYILARLVCRAQKAALKRKGREEMHCKETNGSHSEAEMASCQEAKAGNGAGFALICFVLV